MQDMKNTENEYLKQTNADLYIMIDKLHQSIENIATSETDMIRII